ncbi:MAG: hypothetical protein IKY70_01830 [Bacteroidales bacterium]|nr:hypothetical protein [Bacteroidales bacterium]
MENVTDYDIFASIESFGVTKTIMDDNNNVLWSDEDQIVAFMKTTLGSRYQIMEQFVGTTTGGFSPVDESAGDNGEAEELDHNVVFYPYSADVLCAKNDNNTPAQSYRLDVVLAQTQIYSENSFANGAFPMVAVSSSNQLTFKNVCGGVKLQFKGVNSIKSITLEGLGSELISGKAAVVGYADGSVPSVTMDAEQATKSVTLDCGDGVQLDETMPVTFIISVPPVTFASGMKITVTDTDGKSKTYNNRSSNTVTRSNLLSFPVITYKQPVVEPEPSTPDLSKDGTANCYLVSESGTYKFKAVKGNSTTSVGSVNSAVVLWESFGTSTAPEVGDIIESVSYSDGYVTFSTPATFMNGNASIAVKDDNGVILWSWHIWCSTEGWTDQVYANNTGTMMDRNLGATSATPGDVGALGLLYQWGRKDPFMGASSISECILAVSTGSWSTYGGMKSIDFSVSNPMTYLWFYDWCEGVGIGDPSHMDRWKDSEKTVYDPCPLGYKVPKGGEGGLWDLSYISSNSDSINKGIYWELADGTLAWYPASGYRDCETVKLKSVGTNGSLWASAYHPSLNYIAFAPFFNTDNYVSPDYHNNPGKGFSVRCVRE